jgi:hypothetical protein
VNSAQIKNGAVLTAKIGDLQVVTSKIGNLAVTTPKTGLTITGDIVMGTPTGYLEVNTDAGEKVYIPYHVQSP